MGDGIRPSEGHVFPMVTLSPSGGKALSPSGGKALSRGRQPADVNTSSVLAATLPNQNQINSFKKLPSSPQNSILFPIMPNYDASTTRCIKSIISLTVSFVITMSLIGMVFLIALFTNLLARSKILLLRARIQDPGATRPFLKEEKMREKLRARQAEAWAGKTDVENEAELEYKPTEGGKDPITNDAAYYARRVGLDIEVIKVQTEDYFIISLDHVYDPREYTPMTAEQRAARGPDVFTGAPPSRPINSRKPKFPILMIHGLMQSSGTYCSHDDDSLAFYLCKAGYDVWLGNNRCGFKPEHASLKPSDPRMWAWTPRDMGIWDLPALISRVLSETEFEKLGLVGHSQGTTQTFIALSKDQRPDLGKKLTVFCVLAPAVYAGPILKRWYFRFITNMSPIQYHVSFGIHAFIPMMRSLQSTFLPSGHLNGIFSYIVFNYLFGWSDWNWDRGLRDRCFMCSPTYISSESMRWWLGSSGFAKNGCILATAEECALEIQSDELTDEYNVNPSQTIEPKPIRAWFDDQAPPFAIWASGKDELVDNRKVLNRFQRGREPHVQVVHQKIIEEYEHLDVIWAMDVIEKVGVELRDTLWRTCDVRDKVKIPKGCEGVAPWADPRKTLKDE